jgi:hypothetical protein
MHFSEHFPVIKQCMAVPLACYVTWHIAGKFQCLPHVREIFVTIKPASLFHQDQTKDDYEESDDGCEVPPPNFQLVKTEVIKDSEIDTETDMTANDGLENTDTSKDDSERIPLDDLMDDIT